MRYLRSFRFLLSLIILSISPVGSLQADPAVLFHDSFETELSPEYWALLNSQPQLHSPSIEGSHALRLGLEGQSGSAILSFPPDSTRPIWLRFFVKTGGVTTLRLGGDTP